MWKCPLKHPQPCTCVRQRGGRPRDPNALRRGRLVMGQRVRPELFLFYQARAAALGRTLPEHVMWLLNAEWRAAQAADADSAWPTVAAMHESAKP
jgi:hypothetical protein